jgi:MFS family permease
MSLHQTSVYIGTAGGVALAGYLAERYGWRTPFLMLGGIGLLFASWLPRLIVEPVRGQSDPKPKSAGPYDPPADDELAGPPPGLVGNIVEVVTTPAAALLLAVFVGANFVATAFMTWLPSYIAERFALGLAHSSLTSTAWSLSSLVGVLTGGLIADLAARRAGGRIGVQALALLAAAPFVVAAAMASSVLHVVVTLLGVGFCKGVYDASIFASVFDVVRPAVRGTAAGLMNTVGWSGGALAPVAVGAFSDRLGLGPAIGATAPVYVVSGLLALCAAWLARTSRRAPTTAL